MKKLIVSMLAILLVTGAAVAQTPRPGPHPVKHKKVHHHKHHKKHAKPHHQ